MKIYNANSLRDINKTFNNISTAYDFGFNFGNRLISYSLQKTFEISNDHLINHGENTDNLKKDNDILIFNLQDHLRPELMPKLIDMINQLNGVENIFIANIGVNMFHAAPNFSISKEVVDFLKCISKKYEIGVRGVFTRSLLRSIGVNNVVINGCPSFWAMKIPVEEIYKKSLANIEKLDNEKLNILIGGDVVPQEHVNTSYLSQGDYDAIQSLNAIKSSNLTLNDFGYYGNNVSFFFDHWGKEITLSQLLIPFEPTKRLFEIISNYDLYLGSRIHGCITSMNSGIPAINTNYDFRAIEMCNSLNIPHISHFPGFVINKSWLQTLAERSFLLLQDYHKLREEKYLNMVAKIKNTNKKIN